MDNRRDSTGDRLGCVVLEDRSAHRDARRAGIHRATNHLDGFGISPLRATGDNDRQAGRLTDVLEALGVAAVTGFDDIGTEFLGEPNRVAECLRFIALNPGATRVGHRQHRDAKPLGLAGNLGEFLDLLWFVVRADVDMEGDRISAGTDRLFDVQVRRLSFSSGPIVVEPLTWTM